MAFRYRNFPRISTLLPGFFSGFQCQKCGQTTKLLPSSCSPIPIVLENIAASGAWASFCASRFSTAAKISKEVSLETDLISFISSVINHGEGPFHYWLNRSQECQLKTDGVFLILAETFLEYPPGSRGGQIAMLRKVKFLQQRYPWLHVFGFQSGSSSATADHYHIIRATIEEYVNFPILLCSKTFTEMENGACCILYKGLRDPPLCHDRDTDLTTLFDAIKALSEQHDKDASVADKLVSTWSKHIAVFKEPYACSSLQNLLLYLPACISTDEFGNRLFLSDSNHHRVIVSDINGKILDAIGSSPGFEDGDFETAKLTRPAASYYHTSNDCLYLVDSENHAIRRADMGKRVLETLYPASNEKGRSGLWTWILNKLGFRRDVDMKSVDSDPESLLFPWHILPSEENELLVINKSFDTLWIMDLESGVIRNVIKGHSFIMEFCGPVIRGKTSCLKDVSHNFLQQLVSSHLPLDGNTYSDLLSSFVTLGEHLVFCDRVGHRILMLNKHAQSASSIELSNLGNLGLPYWLSLSLERVFATGNAYEDSQVDHVQSFKLLPGRIDIQFAIDIPDNTELVEPLQESCVWRQARGAAMEVLGVEGTAASLEKVGPAQQWYDELDNLAFVTEPESDIAIAEKSASHKNFGDGKIRTNCIVNTSPGTSEVIVSAPLYLKLKTGTKNSKDTQAMKAAQIAELLNRGRTRTTETGRFIQLLLSLNRELGDLVFMKPIHVKVKFKILNHPKAENSRDIILTDSAIDVIVSLN